MVRLSEPMSEILRGRWRDHWPLLIGLAVLCWAELGLALAMIGLLAPSGLHLDLTASAMVPGVLTLGLTVHHAHRLERARDDTTAFAGRTLRDFYAAGVLFALVLSAAGALAV